MSVLAKSDLEKTAVQCILCTWIFYFAGQEIYSQVYTGLDWTARVLQIGK